MVGLGAVFRGSYVQCCVWKLKISHPYSPLLPRPRSRDPEEEDPENSTQKTLAPGEPAIGS